MEKSREQPIGSLTTDEDGKKHYVTGYLGQLPGVLRPGQIIEVPGGAGKTHLVTSQEAAASRGEEYAPVVLAFESTHDQA